MEFREYTVQDRIELLDSCLLESGLTPAELIVDSFDCSWQLKSTSAWLDSCCAHVALLVADQQKR